MEDFEQVKENIIKTAKDNGLEVTDNVEKIARAKLRFFGREHWANCPCDPKSDRACISDHCRQDINETGVCHCHLYRKAV